MTNKYDIFLSYRRKGGYVTAKHLYDLLSRDGYNVSFDIDTLRNGDFDVELLKRIDECTDFIVILNKDVFARTLDQSVDIKQDWLRNELAYALKKGKNVIPIMLEGFTEFPENLPADIARVQKKNGPKYDQYYFDDFYRKLKEVFLDTPPPAGIKVGYKTWNLKLTTDIDSRIIIDGMPRTEAVGGSMTLIPLSEGTYRIEIISANDDKIKVVKDYTISDTDIIDNICLQEVIDRQKKDSARSAQLKVMTKLLKEYDGPLSWEHSIAGTVSNPPQTKDAGYRICKDGLYGVADLTGKVIIPAEHKKISFSNGMYSAPGRLYDKSGNVVVEIADYEYSDRIGQTSLNGLTCIVDKKKCRYVDRKGNTILSGNWENGTDFIDGIAAVKEGGVWNFINERGQLIVSNCYESICFEDGEWLSEGVIGVQINDKYGFVDTAGREVTPIQYNYICTPFVNGTAVVDKRQHCFIDHGGDTVSNIKAYDVYLSRVEGFLPFLNSSGRLGMISPEKGNVFPTEFDNFPPIFSEGLLLMKKNGKFGFVDLDNNTIIDFIYDQAGTFSGGYAYVESGNRIGIIDKNGTFTTVRTRARSENVESETEKQLTIHGTFCPGFRYVTDEKKRLGVVDKNGNIVVPCMYYCDSGITRPSKGYGVGSPGMDYYRFDYYFDCDYTIQYGEVAMPVRTQKADSSIENLTKIDIWDLNKRRRVSKKESRLIKALRWKNFRIMMFSILSIVFVYLAFLSENNMFTQWKELSSLGRSLYIGMGAFGVISVISLFIYDCDNWLLEQDRGVFAFPVIFTTAFAVYALGWLLPTLPLWLNIIRIIVCVVLGLFSTMAVFMTIYDNIWKKVS